MCRNSAFYIISINKLSSTNKTQQSAIVLCSVLRCLLGLKRGQQYEKWNCVLLVYVISAMLSGPQNANVVKPNHSKRFPFYAHKKLCKQFHRRRKISIYAAAAFPQLFPTSDASAVRSGAERVGHSRHIGKASLLCGSSCARPVLFSG